ncbi:protein of unknown function [Pedobacter terrae]|uniref:eCIS core domain-containing protein n=1 Tax=Pedobacter terrae TaxID=405671 RepID=A0A1G7W2E9_9SPHI|nr:DUF4157 domain-containing protein [Pedobacter terrae]SDG65340.1 protein of unknown function [Pedobacter terrae]
MMNIYNDNAREHKNESIPSNLPKKSPNKAIFKFEDKRPQSVAQRKLQNGADDYVQQQAHPVQKKGTGGKLPDDLKNGIENLSGLSMDDVNVHYNSNQPAQLQAHAYAQGTNIYIAPGQEKHLPHEAWHVVQQKQGRVKPTLQLKGEVNVNDDKGLEHEADVMGSRALKMKIAGNSQKPKNTFAPKKTIQRKGVKAQLHDAEKKFDDFKEETNNINWLRDAVSSDIYNKYKPNQADSSQHFKTKNDRDKSKGSMSETDALLRSTRLNHWADTAIVSAERIYTELKAAHMSAITSGHDGASILMGRDTDVEPDAMINDTTALEVKHVDSAAQGSVDSHVKKGSEQLDKRIYNKNVFPNKKVNGWQLHIEIKNPLNPWPYTPTELDKLVLKGQAPKHYEIAQKAKDRIGKYENGSKLVAYYISSQNPVIGIISVSV